jgi:hypothetical protein
MKRSLLAVCGLALLSAVVSLGGCASDVDDTGEEGTSATASLGESRQDLALNAAVTDESVETDATAAGPGENPQPQPWFTGPANPEAELPDDSQVRVGETSVRAVTNGTNSAPEGNPQPQPWFKSGTSGGTMTTNQ